MPGAPFKKAETGAVLSATEVATSASPEVATRLGQESFAQEMHFQVYRIENALKVVNQDVMSSLSSDILKQPALMAFFNAYGANKTNEFIEKAKTESSEKREELLSGIRKIISKAVMAKKESTTEAGQKQAEEKDKEISKTQEMLQKELTMEDIASIEEDLAMPFTAEKGSMDLNKIQHYYMKIIAGQRAFGTHMQSMQESYGGAIKKFESFNKKYTSGFWHGYVGVVPWAGRTISSGWGQLKRFGNWVRGKKHTPDKSDSEKVNEAIAKAREEFKEKMDRLKSIKTKIDSRSNELKNGLAQSKIDIRGRLKNLIASEDWTKAKLLEKENLKALLERQKDNLGRSLDGIREKGKEIDDARGRASTLKENLALSYEKIKTGEGSLNERVDAVKKRIAQLETTYGKEDPRVLHVRQKVLVPLLQGQDRMAQVKEGTADKLSNVEEDNQRLDLLKADVFVGETNAVDQLAKLELQISAEGKKIDALGKSRTELHQLLEGMETAYMAVDEFKSSVDTNLDKMLKENTKAVEAVDKQYDVLKNIKASEPGLGSSLYNTVGLGKYGLLGTGELILQHPSRIVGWAGKNIGALFSGGKYFEYSKTKKWHIGTAVNWLAEKYDKWVYKNAKDWDKNNSGWMGLLTKPAVFGAGLLKAGVGLVSGVVTIVTDTGTVLESLDHVFSSWSETKKMLKGLVHWDEFSKSGFGAAGQLVGDVVIMVLTGGAGRAAAVAKGAEAAAIAGALGKSAKIAYVGAFVKEVGRQSVNLVKGAVKLPFTAIRAVAKGVPNSLKYAGAVLNGLKNGDVINKFRQASVDLIGNKLNTVGADVAKFTDDILGRGLQLSPDLKVLLDKIKQNGVQSLNQLEFGALRVGLAKQLAKTPGIGNSNLIDKLSKAADKYSRLSSKMDNVNAAIAARAARFSPKAAMSYAYRILNGNITPKSILEVFGGKNALEKAMKSLLGEKGVLSDKLVLVQDKIDKLKIKLKTVKGADRTNVLNELRTLRGEKNGLEALLKRNESAFNAFKVKYDQVKYFENIGPAFVNIKQGVSQKLSSLRNLKGGDVLSGLKTAITMPVWLPAEYFKFTFGMSAGKAEFILNGRNISLVGNGIDNAASFIAIGEVSKKINQAIFSGNLKEAGYLYYASRSLAHSVGIPFSTWDSSFLGYIHRVAPITVKKIQDVRQLQDINVINELPEKTQINQAVLKDYEQKSAAALAGLIKAKPTKESTSK